MHHIYPECLGPVPVFTEFVSFDWPARMKRPFEGEDEKKERYVRALRRPQIPVNDVRLNTVTICYDASTCRDVAFSDRVDQPFSLFFHLAPLRRSVQHQASFSLFQWSGAIIGHPHEVIHFLSWLSFAKGGVRWAKDRV